jgi:hypothetical protein
MDITHVRPGTRVDGPNDRPWGREAAFNDPGRNGTVLSALSAP